MLTSFNAIDELSRLGLDCNKTYFLFCGSFFDRWFSASFLFELLQANPKALIISDKNDIPLLKIFIGDNISRVLTCNANTIVYLRNVCKQDKTCYMPCASQLSSEGQIATPPGIRSLHIVDYPYFIHLSARGCARYIDMLRLICFLPIDAVSSQPLFLNSIDKSNAEQLLLATGYSIERLVIYNIVNYSHANLTEDQRLELVSAIQESGYTAIINAAGLGGDDINLLSRTYSSARIISIPGHLVKSVFDLVPAVIGVIGGAISIADTFSCCSVLTFATRSIGFPGYTSALKRNVNFLEFENMKAEPRPSNSRIVSCINLPDHEGVSPSAIKNYVKGFLQQVSQL